VKVLVCGSRKWVEQAPIERELRKLPPGTIVIHGACRGADNIAGYVAKLLGFEVRPYPADWDLYGPSAGVLRNEKMLREEVPDLALCFTLGDTPGSMDMLRRLEKAGVPVQRFGRCSK
jgi:hypothetical protein